MAKPDFIFVPTDNIYRNIFWRPATQTQGEMYCLVANGGYQTYDTLLEAVAARDLLEMERPIRFRRSYETRTLDA